MSKTFDNIAEAASTNYLFLKAQMTISLEQELPTPPPLFALSFPSQLLCLALWFVSKVRCFALWLVKWSRFQWDRFRQWSRGRHQQASRERSKSEAALAEPSLLDLETNDEATRDVRLKRAASVAMFATTRTWRSLALRKRDSDLRIEARHKTISKAVAKYVLDHQADVAQEERWRTSMQRKMDQHFREMKANQGQMNQNFKDLRAELENTKKQMNAENMEQILSALRGFSAA